MKAILLLCLCVNIWAGDFKLLISEGGLIVSDFTNSCIQLFGSDDFKNWKIIKEFTNRTSLSTNTFYRTRVKPPPPRVLPTHHTYPGTLVLFSGFASAPLSGMWITNGNEVLSGVMESQEIDGQERPQSVSCRWKFLPFNMTAGSHILLCRFDDVNGNTVLTNFTITCLGTEPSLTVTFPTEGMQVVGDYCYFVGKVDNLKSKVSINSIPAVVRPDGIVLARVPVAANNQWQIDCDGNKQTLSFTKSPITITTNVRDQRYMRGQRGMVAWGTISHPGYDLMVNGSRIVTTNQQWQARITIAEHSIINYSIISKGSSAVGAPVGSSEALPTDAAYYVTSYLESYGYYKGANQRTVKTLYKGMDSTNLYVVDSREDGKECSAEYFGIGEDLMLQEFDGPCNWNSYRPLIPKFIISNFSECTTEDRIGCYAKSGCKLSIGGDPMDPKMYQITVGFEVDEMTMRFGNEVCFENVTPSIGWKIGGRAAPWTFVAYNGYTVDVTPEMPLLNDAKWCQYRITMVKTPVP